MAAVVCGVIRSYIYIGPESRPEGDLMLGRILQEGGALLVLRRLTEDLKGRVRLTSPYVTGGTRRSCASPPPQRGEGETQQTLFVFPQTPASAQSISGRASSGSMIGMPSRIG